jgi:hypothetical protein
VKTDTATDLTVTYADIDAARDAVRALERAGVEGHDITLLGEADAAALGAQNIQRDERLIAYVGRSARLGAAVGALVGAAAGFGVGALLFSWLSGGMWSMVGGGAFLGAGLGVLLGGIARLPQSNAGLATIDTPVTGEVTVGISTTIDLTNTIESTQPLAVAQVDDVSAVLAEQRSAASADGQTSDPVASLAAQPEVATPRPADEQHATDISTGRPDWLPWALATVAVAAVSIVMWVRRRA